MGGLTFHLAPQDGFEFVFSKGTARSYPLHTHVNTLSLTLVRRGMVEVLRPSGRFLYRPGDIYIDTLHVPHRPVYSDNFDLISVCIKKNLFGQRKVLIQLFDDYAYLLRGREFLSSEDINRLSSCLGQISYEFKQDRNLGLDQVAELADIDLADVSGLYPPVGSTSHFSRRFKKTFGLTPHQYLLQCRIRSAKKLILSDCSLSLAAFQAGFCDQSHLNRCFKKNIGLTPREYLKACHYLGI